MFCPVFISSTNELKNENNWRMWKILFRLLTFNICDLWVDLRRDVFRSLKITHYSAFVHERADKCKRIFFFKSHFVFTDLKAIKSA